MSVRPSTVHLMTVIDPSDVDWTGSTELAVTFAARSGIEPAITEGLRRGLWREGEDPPDPLNDWFPTDAEPVAGGRVELRPRDG